MFAMNDLELAARATAWTWAARTMGVEADETRIAGLVEVTMVVPLADLKAAISGVMRTEPNGFLPSPGAVVAAYKAISDHRAQTRQLDRPREMSKSDHLKWMAEKNPEGWDDRTWVGYIERMATDAAFKQRVDANFKQRHNWAETQCALDIKLGRVAPYFLVDHRRHLNEIAIARFDRCNPFADGWVPSRDFDPIAGLAKRISG
jgi:hypothetical protein